MKKDIIQKRPGQNINVAIYSEPCCVSSKTVARAKRYVEAKGGMYMNIYIIILQKQLVLALLYIYV